MILMLVSFAEHIFMLLTPEIQTVINEFFASIGN